VVRKELAGGGGEATGAPFEQGIYNTQWTDRTYADCLRRAEKLLFEGKRVLVDASFREQKRRRAFMQAATSLGVPGIVLICRAEPAVVRARLDSRSNDASDADWQIYLQAAARWQEPTDEEARMCHDICTSTTSESAANEALSVLCKNGLHG